MGIYKEAVTAEKYVETQESEQAIKIVAESLGLKIEVVRFEYKSGLSIPCGWLVGSRKIQSLYRRMKKETKDYQDLEDPSVEIFETLEQVFCYLSGVEYGIRMNKGEIK